MMLLEFSMYPTDKGESVSKYVARSLHIIDKSGLPYKLTPMGTVLEGEFDACMRVVKKCYLRMRADSRRIAIVMKADYRRGGKGRLTGKIASVERRLKRKLKR